MKTLIELSELQSFEDEFTMNYGLLVAIVKVPARGTRSEVIRHGRIPLRHLITATEPRTICGVTNNPTSTQQPRVSASFFEILKPMSLMVKSKNAYELLSLSPDYM